MSRYGERVAVVGGGIAGLATAALLAADGRSVDLLEQRDEVGGRAGSWERDGFRFDTGPSWYLMPEVFEHFFGLLGTSAARELDLTRLDPGYRVFFEGHDESLEVRSDRAESVALFERVEPGAGAALEDYLDSAKRTYDAAVAHFLYTSFEHPRSVANADVLRSGPHLLPLLARSLESHVAARFTDRRLRQILGYPAVFLGSAPSRTPAMYHLMSWMDLADGVLYPQGGFTRLIGAIADLARAHGVRIHTGARVTSIGTVPRRRAAGVRRRRARVSGVTYRDRSGDERTLPADVVVGAADLHHLETELLPPELQTYPVAWWRRRDPGPGAVLVYLGVEGALPQLAHHSLFFTADWEANFTDVLGRPGRVPDPASAYVCKPSATDPSVAPPGHENVFVLIPVPADVDLGRGGIDRAGAPAVEAAADAAIAQIAAWAGIPDLAERIRVRRTVGPGDFAADLNAWSGGMLGPGHTLRQSAFLRGRNASSRVDGLFYAGSSTIPGIGLPMCLISAELVLKRLRGDRSTGPSTTPLRRVATEVG